MTTRLALIAACLMVSACAPEEEALTPFTLRFAALLDGRRVGCTDDLTGFGPAGAHRVGLNDLRFYVSNLQFRDAAGNPVELTLDSNEFQYNSANGSVALVDLTGNTAGSCGGGALAFSEGTARTHLAITGTTRVDRVASVSFDVGVPQRLMKRVIATNTPEGAPSPLNEMYWNWNSGYRHFVFNFAVTAPGGATGGGYVHVGSMECAPMTGRALEDRETCTYVNTPSVALGGFNLEADTVGIDLRRVLEGLSFVAPIYDPMTFAVIGEGPGVECHSSPMQPACPTIFGRFGLDMTNGRANASADTVFVKVR